MNLDTATQTARQLAALGYERDPAAPGWWRSQARTGYFGDILGVRQFRIETDDKVRLRVYPRLTHCNSLKILHGGFVMSAIDHALFVGPAALGIQGAFGGQTISMCTDFLAPMKAQMPIDTVVEIMRDTYRMIFLRGIVEQDGSACVSFSGKTRKMTQRPVSDGTAP